MTKDNYDRDKHNLDWAAFCYLSGDMTAEESVTFEERLAAEQPAREALARAVELTQAVASAEAAEPVTVAPARAPIWSRRLSWMAIGAAASLLVAVLWTGADVGSRLQAWLSQPQSSAEKVELAAAWHATQQELAAAESEADDQSDDASSIDMSDMPETPSWMTAAVASYAAQPPSEQPLEN